MKLDVAIAHAGFDERRAAPFTRLVKQLDAQGAKPLTFVSPQREHAQAWAVNMWAELARRDVDGQGPDAWIVLNDDVEVCPRLLEFVEAARLHLGEEILSLHCQLPASKSVVEAGGKYLQSYWASGPGYVLPRGTARKVLDYFAAMPRAMRDAWNEDGYLNMFAWSRRRPIWHLLPALVQHDTKVPSTLGYDDHTLRTAVVDWNTMAPELVHFGKRYWRPDGPAPFVENPWMTTAQLVELEHQYDRGDRYSIIIATPHRGELHHGHVASVHQLMRARGLNPQLEEQLNNPEVRWLQEHDDLTRCRSRMVRTAYVNGGSHLLFADADCSFPIEAVARMLLTGKDFVQAPYMRRDGHGYSIKGTAERRAYVKENPGAGLQPSDVMPDDTVEIDGTGLGLTLISRECMHKMLEHYADEPLPVAELEAIQGSCYCKDGGATFELMRQAYELGRTHGHRLKVIDHRTPSDPGQELVALFMLMVRDGELLGEDISFAQRWKDIGGKVWLYLGPGSPIGHHGEHLYQGKREDFGITRKEAGA